MNLFKRIPLFGAYLLLAYMPFHVFLSQSLSLLTGGLDVWKLAKEAVVAVLALVGLVIIGRQGLHRNPKVRLIALLFSGYAFTHVMTYLINGGTSLSVALLATAYNVRPFLLLVIGIAAVTAMNKYDMMKVVKFALIISSVVAALGVVQYFLPYDILTHVGYSDARGAKPSFLIDNKPDLPRIMSTLREPNSLGAYLVVPIVLLTGMVLRRRRMLFVGLLLLHVLALLLTFSRSALLSLFIAEVIFLGALYGKQLTVWVRRYGIYVAAAVLTFVIGIFMLRDQYVVQNVLFHSDENTVAVEDSNDKHLSSVQRGVSEIIERPIGYGPGTAGPVSMHTDTPFITENYYIQLGYEVGLIGLAIFIALSLIIFFLLKNIGTSTAIALSAAFIGYAVCNLFLHTWANEAVATQWWLLAGLFVGSALLGSRPKDKNSINNLSSK